MAVIDARKEMNTTGAVQGDLGVESRRVALEKDAQAIVLASAGMCFHHLKMGMTTHDLGHQAP
jgi:hypothetical protein